MRWWRRWRQARLLRRQRIPAGLWNRVVADTPLLQGYGRCDRHQLRVLASRFLGEKVISGAGGLQPDDYMRVVIAAQACVLVLNLGLDYYRGWREIVLYPDSFRVHADWQDEYGVVHQGDEWRDGEAWQQGPLILAWGEIDPSGQVAPAFGQNVVIHEFAHKLDLLNGEADGFPPLHPQMSIRQWREVFTREYSALQNEVELGYETRIDPYAASDPAEFFAVLSEYFFTEPCYLFEAYPELYGLLNDLYQQNRCVSFDKSILYRQAIS